jgi:hypothetical protein
MIDIIQHIPNITDPVPTSFHILILAKLLYIITAATVTLATNLLLLPLLLPPLFWLLAIKLSYYFATNHFATDILSPGVVELTTQLLILPSVLWLPLCRINKFGLNTLPSKTIAIPYTCGLSGSHLCRQPLSATEEEGGEEGRRILHRLACKRKANDTRRKTRRECKVDDKAKLPVPGFRAPYLTPSAPLSAAHYSASLAPRYATFRFSLLFSCLPREKRAEFGVDASEWSTPSFSR